MEKRFPFVTGYLLSFVSPAFYDDVARRWKGAAAGYLILLVVVCWALMAWVTYSWMTHFVENEVPHFTKKLPALTYEDGMISTPEPRPYTINLHGDPDLLIDTANLTSEEERAKHPVVLTDTEIIFSDPSGRTETYAIDEFASFLKPGTMTPPDWKPVVRIWVLGLYAAYLIFWLGFSLAFAFFAALVMSLLALLLNGILSKNLEFPALYRLAAVALTPAYLIWTFLPLFGFTLPLGFWSAMLVPVGVTILYTVFAVFSVKPVEAPPTTNEPVPPSLA